MLLLSFRQLTDKLLIFCFFIFSIVLHLNAQSSLFWDNDQWPLKEVSEKNYYGRAKLSPAELIQRLNHVFLFYDSNNKLIPDFKKRLFTFYNTGNSAAYYNVKLLPDMNKILGDNQTPMIKNLNNGDQIIMDFVTMDDRTFHFIIDVTENENTYSPGLKISRYGLNITYDYQVLKTPTDETILKVDSSVASNKKIIAGYKKLPNTQIKYIPGFKTSQNFIFEADSTVEFLKYNLKIHPKEKMKKSWLADAVEPQNLISKPAKLIWHKMVADPESATYSLRYGQNMAHLAMFLEINDTIYDIRSLRVTFYNHQGLNSTIYVDSEDFGELGKFFGGIKAPLSIIIDRVVVKDNFSDRLIFDPQVFMFNFE
jgi:hypothetical protein